MATTKENPADKPDYQGDDYAGRLREAWEKVDACLGGTTAMREARDKYLPQFPSEHDDVYDDRVKTATFDGDYADTLDGIVGMVYRKPIKLGDNIPARIKSALENVDLAGTHFDVFAPRFTRRGIHQGAAYILVDMQQNPTGQALDDAQARALNLRPFWKAYGAKELQNEPRYVAIRGAQVMQQIVFRESICEPSGLFGEEEILQYRVWRLPVSVLADGTYTEAGPVEWEIWREQGEGNAKRLEIFTSGQTRLRRIPVAVFIANPDDDNERECEGPTLEDLADLCIKHYQQQSDHESNLHLCNSPIPFTVNLREEGSQTDQPWGKGVRYDLGEGGMAGYAEPLGTGLQAMERQLATVKEQIKQKGLELVLEGGANAATTATEQLLRAGKRASRLSMITSAVHDCFETAIGYMAEWIGLAFEEGGEITMGVRGDELTLTSADITALSANASKGQLSLKTMWAILQRGGILPDEFNADVELQQIADERAQTFDQQLSETEALQAVTAPAVAPV